MRNVYPNLSRVMEERGCSPCDLATLIGISEPIVRLKLLGAVEWMLSEAIVVCKHFEHPDVGELFLRLDYKY